MNGMKRRAATLSMILCAGLALARPHAATRVIAIGDLHGDLAATRRALRLAGAIDKDDHWSGGTLTIVQTGDITDRGDDEPEILSLFERLTEEAARVSGRVIVLNGNHELMNAAGDFRYVTSDGMSDFGGSEGRRRAFAPGSPTARKLATHSLFAIVGDTVFVHGGVLPAHVRGGLPTLESLDTEARAWLRGDTTQLPHALVDDDSPLWTRRYGMNESPAACAAATAALTRLGLSHMVVGHTVQPQGINSICQGRVWRIDVGLSKVYGGPTEVLAIESGKLNVLRAAH